MILDKIRAYLSDEQPKVEPTELAEGWNTVKVRLDIGGEVTIIAGHPPYNTESQDGDTKPLFTNMRYQPPQ